MPLHEYEENKRRKNIDALMASGACHICGSTARNTKGFSHCLDHEDSSSNYASAQQQQHHYNDMGTSIVPAPQTASMRSCACFGQSKSDPDYWPYSLRCCEMCIADDCTTGRVRSCGICGAVACDENCGVELVECTDDPEWNNMGCLECRRKECFSEIDIFKTQTVAPDGTNVPRMTRVCVKCLEKCTPWVKYDFTCRLFKCKTRLVPSNVMERKRFRTFGSSPLNLLPEDGLAAVVDFLSNRELKALYLTNSAMCTIAERVAKTRVEACHHFFPPGPLKVGTRKSPYSGKIDIPWVRLEGTNNFNIRAPEDGKFWVGILHHMEQIASKAFYFAQTQNDDDAVCRFMQNPEDKFQFSQVYIKENQSTDARIIPRPTHPVPSVNGILIRSSHVLITDNTVKLPFITASSEDLVDGTYRFICRLFSPGSGSKSSNRDSLGSFGILSKHQTEGGEQSITWAKKIDILEGCQQEDSIFGFEYDTETRRITVYSLRIDRFITSEYSVADTVEGDLVFAIELTAKTAKEKGSLLAVRKCDESEWEKFQEEYHDDEEDRFRQDDNDDINDAIIDIDGLGDLEMPNRLPQPRRRPEEVEDNRQERVRARPNPNNEDNNNDIRAAPLLGLNARRRTRRSLRILGRGPR